MAKIWPVYEGREPTTGGPWAEIPLADAEVLFEIGPEDFVSGSETTPRFGNVDRDLRYQGYKLIVVEIERQELGRRNWDAGFYRSRVKPGEAFDRLIQQALASELGAKNVVRIAREPTTDSLGRDALKITVVVAPGAVNRLADDAALNALVRLRARLHEMHDERTPIVEYATEAELAQDGSA